MLAPHRPIRASRPYRPPTRITPDVAWELTWPFMVTIILGTVIIVFVLIIFGLEIGSLAKGTESGYGNTASTGAGFWCGIFILLAGVLIIVASFMRSLRFWATVAFIATVVAACFTIILLALDAKAVQDGTVAGTLAQSKHRILAAQLAFAVIEFFLCLAFIGIYIFVLLMAPRRLRQPHLGGYR